VETQTRNGPSGDGEVPVHDVSIRVGLADHGTPELRLQQEVHRQPEIDAVSDSGLDASFGAALLVGYHARAGAGPGVLNHTWVGKELHDLRLNGEPVGEIALVAMVAEHFGVPIALVTGDGVACREARARLRDVRTMDVKRSVDRFSVETEHPAVAARRIEEAAAESVRAAARLDVAPTPEAPRLLRPELGFMANHLISVPWTFWVVGVGNMLATCVGLLRFSHRKGWV
jgi:hypothetical protein